MENEDIRIARSIIHILDSSVGVPVLSDKELELVRISGIFFGGISCELREAMILRAVVLIKRNQRYIRFLLPGKTRSS